MARVWRKPSRLLPGVVTGRGLAKRLRDNSRVLREAYSTIAKAVREERAITPAAEWLIDNFYVVQEQIRQVREDFPRGFYRGLPKLADGPFKGYPRVFGVAWAFVAHTDSRFEPAMLRRFVQAYQKVAPLTIGELWAVAITLRIVLVENLRRGAEQIVNGRAARDTADALADRMLGTGGRNAEAPEVVLRGFDRKPLRRAFAVQLVQRLRDQDPKVLPALRWLDECLASLGTTADEAVRAEHQAQGASNVTVRNVITSMRLISAVDWTEFFESVSLVDAALCASSDFRPNGFSRRGTATATRSKNWREARPSRNSKSRRARLQPRSKLRAATPGDGSEPRPSEQEPGLLPYCQGTAHDRKGDRIPCSDQRMADSGQRRRGHFRLRKRDRDPERSHFGPRPWRASRRLASTDGCSSCSLFSLWRQPPMPQWR